MTHTLIWLAHTLMMNMVWFWPLLWNRVNFVSIFVCNLIYFIESFTCSWYNFITSTRTTKGLHHKFEYLIIDEIIFLSMSNMRKCNISQPLNNKLANNSIFEQAQPANTSETLLFRFRNLLNISWNFSCLLGYSQTYSMLENGMKKLLWKKLVFHHFWFRVVTFYFKHTNGPFSYFWSYLSAIVFLANHKYSRYLFYYLL